MGALSEYLERMERNLVGMDLREKKRALRTVEIQIIKLSEDYGGGENGIKKAIQELGPPEMIARKYSERYSLGFQDHLMISAVSILLATFTLPVIPFTYIQNIFSLITIIFLASFIIFVGINWGMKPALLSALLSGVWRSFLFQLTLWIYPFELHADMGGIYLVHISSVLLLLMALVFPIPGKE